MLKKNKILIITSSIFIAVIAILFFRSLYSSNLYADPFFKKIRKEGKLVVGTFQKIEPMTFKGESGENIGFDMDVIDEIAKRIGVTVEIKEIFFPELFDAIDKKEIDVAISAITITKERQEKYLFSSPYFTSGQVIMTRKDNIDIKNIEDLNGKKVGVPRGTTVEEEMKKYPDIGSVIAYDDFSEIQSLINGEIDAIVHDYTAATVFVKQNPSLKIVSEDPITSEFFGIATHKDNQAFVEKIDEIIRDMKRKGKLQEIKNKWF